VRAGNTFVTVGPLVQLTVEGVAPGGRVNLLPGGGTIDVSWHVESATLPLAAVEIVLGGLTAETIRLDQTASGGQWRASGHCSLTITDSTWIALRVRGSYHGRPEQIAAHTSAVQLLVDGKALFAAKDAMLVLEQIEGALAYVDTIAPRPAAQRFKQLRATLESAHNRLHQRLHQNGLFHRHTPLHTHDTPQEH
jgi:hypothetical protein